MEVPLCQIRYAIFADTLIGHAVEKLHRALRIDKSCGDRQKGGETRKIKPQLSTVWLMMTPGAAISAIEVAGEEFLPCQHS